MCFYVYSPNKSITVDFTSESIHLNKDGSSNVAAIFLVRNNTEHASVVKKQPCIQPKDILRIIYPNKLSEHNGFKNKTAALIKYRKIDSKELFNTTGFTISFETPEGEWPQSMAVTWGNPDKPGEYIKHSGLLYHKNQLAIAESLTDNQKAVLQGNNYTILTYKLEKPLTDKGAWIYIKFKGSKAAHNFTPTFDNFVNRFTNSFQYIYNVFGPLDVKDYFINKLQTFHLSEFKGSDSFNETVGELKTFFERDGIITNKSHANCTTTYKKYFIRINPGRMGEITNINHEKNIKEAQRPSGSSGIWDGTYGWMGPADESKDFSFQIKFNARPSYIIYKLLPVIAILFTLETRFHSDIANFFNKLFDILASLPQYI